MTDTKIKYLQNYQQPNYWVDNVQLQFEILDDKVIVVNTASYIKNKTRPQNTLTLNGSSKLISISLDNNPVDYTLADDELSLIDLPDIFTLKIATEVNPFDNKSCMGLYASNGNLFTQNEPEGFRKITYYQDRSDVMATFTTMIIADKTTYPILLSNGNKIDEVELDNNRHKITWQDPFKKPSYLFALVAGKFSVIQDIFTTKSKRQILLEVYSDADSIDQCGHSMDSLKRAMKWDEERFNLEYDLERYMIVASGDFNMGAMENKGLNIFNTKYVLADIKTATDTDFINVEAVVGHEYFHNWTGNRVTCRDWFQLSLKEGLTVFRDQEFTADLHSRDVKRIQEVRTLRQMQFPEDSSPLAHPVRPASYLEINNFYTVTIYEKGSEVVRMYQTILGKNGFNKGLKLYFERHDGTAATCDDFCTSMADANSTNLDQFMLWYSQAGTPRISISDDYNSETQIYTLNFRQEIPDTPDMQNKKPMLIPIAFGLLASDGTELDFEIIFGNVIKPEHNHVYLLKEFDGIAQFKVSQKPTPSLFRDFSAPVINSYAYSNEQLLTIATHDSDSFSRWEALQTLYKQEIIALYHNDEHQTNRTILDIVQKTIQSDTLDASIKNLLLTLPSIAELYPQLKPVHIHKLHNAFAKFKLLLADSLELDWLNLYTTNQIKKYNFNDSGKRAVKNTALAYLCASQAMANYLPIVQLQYQDADNMTDKIGALVAINDSYDSLRDQLLQNFATQYAKYPLVMDKWFTLQAQSQKNNTLEKVKELTTHESYDASNPNKLYALVRSFDTNSKLFNTLDGYQWIANETVRIDKFNPSVAGRIAASFSIISSLDSEYQEIAKKILTQMIQDNKLSNDVFEIISKTLSAL